MNISLEIHQKRTKLIEDKLFLIRSHICGALSERLREGKRNSLSGFSEKSGLHKLGKVLWNKIKKTLNTVHSENKCLLLWYEIVLVSEQQHWLVSSSLFVVETDFRIQLATSGLIALLIAHLNQAFEEKIWICKIKIQSERIKEAFLVPWRVGGRLRTSVQEIALPSFSEFSVIWVASKGQW